MKRKIQFKGSLGRFLKWPLIILIPLLLFNVAVYSVKVKAGVLMTAGILLYGIVVYFIFRYYQPKLVNEMLRFAVQYQKVERELFDDLPIPYLLLDCSGKIIWSNRIFADITEKKQNFDKDISSIFPELDVQSLGREGYQYQTEVTYREHHYKASMQKVKVNEIFKKNEIFQIKGMGEKYRQEEYIISLSLFDNTELEKAIQAQEENKLVVGLACLDNYEEALQSVEEVRRSLLIALIDRKITKYFSNFDGLVKKMEKDKYLLLLRKGKLEEIEDKKFSILEDVKTVNIGNDMQVTLSMGIGVDGQNYIQNYEYARTAMEMALGRGGDQTVVKQGNAIRYFGGKSQTVEKNTRVKARVKAQALKEFISAKERVVVMGHKITDVDSFGAAIGVYRAGKTLGKPVHIVINDATTSIRPLMNTFLNSSEYENGMFISGNEAKSIVDSNTVVVVVDTNKPSYTECEELLKLTKTIVVLDHHRRGNEVIENAVLSYIEPYASSACEMVAEILQYFSDGVRIRNIEADSMYAGIMIDTNNFTARAGVRTFEAAAFLRRNGADVIRVRKMLRDNLESYKARAETIRSAEIYNDCYAIGICPGNNLDSPTIVGAQAANELLNIENVKASFVFTEYREVVYISARSIDEVNVQVLMEKLGGGGHMNVAGAQVNVSVGEGIQMLKDILDELEDKGEKE